MDRHRVGPKGFFKSVLEPLHRGHRACSKMSISVNRFLPDGGGARPNCFNACLPFSDILSDVHGSLKETFTETFAIPYLFNTSTTSCFIMSMAGHPTKVGVISTVTLSFSIMTLLITPKSTSDKTGISGSLTSSSHVYICFDEMVCMVIGITLTTK